MKLILILLFISTSALGKSYFYRSWGQKYQKKSSYWALSTSYWKSIKKIDINGLAIVPVETTNYASIRGSFLLYHSLFSNLQLGVEGKGILNSYSAGSGTHSVNSMDDASILIKYLFPADINWHLGLEFRYSKVMFTNGDPTVISIGDDIDSMTMSALGSYYLSKDSLINFSFGFHRYMEQQSSEVLYRFEYASLFRSWDLFAGVAGVFSLKNDVYTDDPSEKLEVSLDATNLYNSVNREFVEGYVGIVKKWKTWGIRVEGGSRFVGKSTDLGYWGGVSLIRGVRGNSVKKLRQQAFKEYDIEGEVIKISPRGKYIKINFGLAKDLDRNMRIDIYRVDFFGENILVATGVVQDLKATWSIIRIVKKYRQLKIEKGWSARAY